MEETPNHAGSTQGDRLDSWKQIATYLGKGVRTVIRWEKTEGLPVHRHPHETRSSVFAYKSELDAWRSNRPTEPTEAELPVRPRRWRWAAVSAVVVLAMLLMSWVWRQMPRPGPDFPLKTEPLTSYPGEQYSPSFSPDGSHFAFVWNGPRQDNFDVYIQTVGLPEPRRLTYHPDVDFSPAWSPDGRWIAFLRRSPQDHVTVWLIAALGGTERKLAELSVVHYMDGTQLSWSPDGKWLAVADREGGSSGLFLLSVERGEKRRLTKTELVRGHLDPTFSPDGKHLAFRCDHDDFRAEICTVPVTADMRAGGEPEHVTRLGSRSTSPVWTADGSAILFSSGVLFSDGSLYRIPAFPKNASSIEPQQLTSAVGETHCSLAATHKDDGVAYTRKKEDVNIWRVEFDGTGWKAPQVVPLLSSGRYDMEPAFSPDGEDVAFASDRSGSLEIWVAQKNGWHPYRVTSVGALGAQAPKWSPNGRLISFVAGGPTHGAVHVVDRAGGKSRKLAEPGWQPSWSRNGRWLYYVERDDVDSRIFKVPSGGGPPTLVTALGGSSPQESLDGRFLYFRRQDNVWRMPIGGGAAEQVTHLSAHVRSYVVARDGVFTLDMFGANIMSHRRVLRFHSFADGSVTEVASTNRRPFWGLTVSPDGKTVLFCQADQVNTDIMLMRGVR
jgi:eukaryotic-like serine/threonine-protein kinase